MHAAYVIISPSNKMRANPPGAAYLDDEAKIQSLKYIITCQMNLKQANAPNVC